MSSTAKITVHVWDKGESNSNNSRKFLVLKYLSYEVKAKDLKGKNELIACEGKSLARKVTTKVKFFYTFDYIKEYKTETQFGGK